MEFTSKEAAAPLMSVAAPLWLWKFLEKIQNFGIFFANFENYGEFWKISNYNFQSRRQISTLGGVCWPKMQSARAWLLFYMISLSANLQLLSAKRKFFFINFVNVFHIRTIFFLTQFCNFSAPRIGKQGIVAAQQSIATPYQRCASAWVELSRDGCPVPRGILPAGRGGSPPRPTLWGRGGSPPRPAP